MTTINNTDDYCLGVDFGTLSVRASVVRVRDGYEVASSVVVYPQGVIESGLPGTGICLKKDSALQDAEDYLAALFRVVPGVIKDSGVDSHRIVALGMDFTSCTVLPTTQDGTPLSSLPQYRSNPHAWVKLWKHHAAQPEADHINEVARRRGEMFLDIYGGKYSSEWFFSKALETLREAPEVYNAAWTFIEAGDWITWQLTGSQSRCISAAGFKSMVVHPTDDGQWTFPSEDFFHALHPEMRGIVREKNLDQTFLPLGARAGGLSREMAERLGLCEGIPIAAANIDAHVAVPACGVSQPGQLVMIMGTSTCHLMVSQEKKMVQGMCGVVRDGVLPGYWGYEAGQSGVGDCFAWFIQHACPAYLLSQAEDAGMTLYELLEQQASSLEVGESGLIALDWWGGNRSVLVDSDLTGLIVGLSTASRPHEIYRALMEATAFGTLRIIEAFVSSGVAIHQLIACGGLAKKNPLLMQIYADVTGLPIWIAASEQTCALGAAMYGALAAGCFNSIQEASAAMARCEDNHYIPSDKNHLRYQSLYRMYKELHDYFGNPPASILKSLKSWRRLEAPESGS